MIGMLIVYLLILGVAFYLLAKICDTYFVGSLGTIAKKLRLNDDVAGATLMAVGSSAPEFFTALIAIFSIGGQSIGTGTIIGSALFNLLIIIGGSAIVGAHVQKKALQKQGFLRDMAFYGLSILTLYVTFIDGIITRWEGGIYVGVYILYVILLKHWSERFPDGTHHHQNHHTNDQSSTATSLQSSTSTHTIDVTQPFFRALRDQIIQNIDKAVAWRFPKTEGENGQGKYIQVFFTSIIGIGLISWILVLVAQEIALLLGIAPIIVALTVVALGTSIPDTISSFIVAKKSQMDMAISNAVGSNTFNILMCLGFPRFIYTLITGNAMVVETSEILSSVILLCVSIILVTGLIALSGYRVRYRHGLLFIGLYIGYLIYVILKTIG